MRCVLGVYGISGQVFVMLEALSSHLLVNITFCVHFLQLVCLLVI